MTEPEDDFAAMFEASLKPRRFDKGQTLEGVIVGIGPDVAFVDVGGKGEATIDLAELRDADGNIEVAVGDRIQATVMSTGGGVTLSRKLVRHAANARQLESAFQAGLPVEGKVEAEVKGGYEVRVAGQRAFCPYSQIDIRRTEPATHIGRVYQFRIIEYKDGGKTLVVSRRAILEEEQKAKADEIRQSIVPGAVLTGHVTSVPEFGAFVDLGGGVQGLLHVSEMGWSRVTDPSQVVKPGEEITVRVLRVDDDGKKIALGLKQLTADPWSTVPTKYRSRPGAHWPGHESRRVRSIRRARARSGSTGARLDVCANWPIARMGVAGSGWNDGALRNPEHRPREEADRRRPGPGRLNPRRRGDGGLGRGFRRNTESGRFAQCENRVAR